MKVWVTKDGKRIPYNKLAISHILHIINYAKTYGFHTSYVSKSTIDNTDDIIVTHDCSREVINEMYNELSRRFAIRKLFDFQ